MLQVDAFLIPRRDLGPEDLKRLGKCIQDWFEDADESNLAPFCDPLPLNDLLSGELPQPLALRETVGPLEFTKESQDLIDSKGGDVTKLTPEELASLEMVHRSPEKGALAEETRKLGDASNLRGVRIGFGHGGRPCNRDELVESLGRFVPAGLLDTILFNRS